MWDLGIPSCTLIAIPDAHPEGYFLKKETRVTERSNTSEKIEKLSAVTGHIYFPSVLLSGERSFITLYLN